MQLLVQRELQKARVSSRGWCSSFGSLEEAILPFACSGVSWLARTKALDVTVPCSFYMVTQLDFRTVARGMWLYGKYFPSLPAARAEPEDSFPAVCNPH